jgi:hypothetical protein
MAKGLPVSKSAGVTKNAMPRANAAAELLNLEAMMFLFRESEWLSRGYFIVLNWLTQRQTLFPVNHVLR